MKVYYKIWLCFLFFLIIGCDTFVSAQTDKALRKHVIIALDRYPGLNNQGKIRQALSDSSIMVPKLLGLLDSILSDNDYVSLVNYGLGIDDDSFDDYTTNTICWLPYETFRLNIQSSWSSIALNHNNKGESFSMISGGKYFSLHSLYDKNEEKYANKTYLIDVNDDYFNGNDDYKKEFVKHYKGKGGKLDFGDFKSSIISVCQQYYFEHKKEFLILKDGKEEKYNAIFYEINPKPVAISTIIDYPAYLGIHRVRGGYRLSFVYNNVSSDYHLHRLEISPMQNNLVLDTVVMTKESDSVKLDIDGRRITGDILQVMIRGWLEPIDTIYSGVVLSPFDDNFRNLTVLLNIPLKDEIKILNIIPLYDCMWWWCKDDLAKAVRVWDIIGGVIIVIVVGFILYKLLVLFSTYRPSNHKIRITHL